MTTRLTLPEIVNLAQQVLDENGVAPSSKRAAPVLSRRSVRWYSSAGVIGVPGRDGHTAIYGRRHLLQLLYTRKYQSNGVSLGSISQATASLSTEDLAARINLDLSSVPTDLVDVAPHETTPFWERSPSDAAADPVAGPSGSILRSLTTSSSSAPSPAGGAALMIPLVSVEYVVHVGPVSVALDHDPSPSELTAITAAAQPLLASLSPAPPTPGFSSSSPTVAPPSLSPTTASPRSSS